jgi:hypothetical protein
MIDLIFIATAFICGFVADSIYNRLSTNKVSYPEVERMATFILMSNNLKEIKDFAKSKVDFIKTTTFNKLCAKIEELSADQIINEDEHHLKVRISTLEDKEIELKKLQAESFIETLKTIKKMCR